VGYPPFFSEEPSATCQKIMNWSKFFTIPAEANLSPQAIDLIRKLITDASDKNWKELIIFNFIFRWKIGSQWSGRDQSASFFLRGRLETNQRKKTTFCSRGLINFHISYYWYFIFKSSKRKLIHLILINLRKMSHG